MADGSQTFNTLALALQEGVARGIAVQATLAAQKVANAAQRAQDRRAADPFAQSLLLTFDRQVRAFAVRAQCYQAAGAKHDAIVWAQAAQRAYRNGQTVRAAIYDPDDE